uniref:Uncharacterized protein n=1 Tax=Salix viminalis TaxID=40686 RepID=A0A6N2N0R6_SALVM
MVLQVSLNLNNPEKHEGQGSRPGEEWVASEFLLKLNTAKEGLDASPAVIVIRAEVVVFGWIAS